MIAWWGALLISLVGVLIGGVIGFFISKKVFEKQLEKNPPINENMIRAMYSQMGRKPSESQIKSVIQAMKRQQKLTNKK